MRKLTLKEKAKLVLYYFKKKLKEKYRRWQAKRHLLKFYKHSLLSMEHEHEYMKWQLPSLGDVNKNKYLVSYKSDSSLVDEKLFEIKAFEPEKVQRLTKNTKDLS